MIVKNAMRIFIVCQKCVITLRKTTRTKLVDSLYCFYSFNNRWSDFGKNSESTNTFYFWESS